MEIRVLSINEFKEKVPKDNIKAIIVSSYNNDIKDISGEDKLLLKFDDITYINTNSFSKLDAKKIKEFVNKIDFEKYQLYICCDSGVSRSSAIAACIMRKYGENENIIWKDYSFHPNILVYKILCDEFELKNSKLRLFYKMFINKRALRKRINKSRIKGIERIASLSKSLNNTKIEKHIQE